ncbi:cellulose binding domain-containing protein [Glycomyces albidus]|uniref:cellulose binding domain-containing protein n=1 Tax=Glycomyces albidus TaxID=2656774 RepID=UPI0038992A27
MSVVGSWSGGWQGKVTVTAGQAAIGSWKVTWTWPGSQTIGSAWNASWSQTGAAVTASDVGWNGTVAAGQSREAFGFIANGATATPQATCTTA